MNTDIFKGQWKENMGSLKKAYGKLTDDTWAQIDGNLDKFLGSVQTAYGVTKDEANLQLLKWEKDQREKPANSTSSTTSSAA